MSSKQLTEWQAYDVLDPVGSWRDDIRAAKLESQITNIANALFPKKGTKPVVTSPLDFMIDWTGDDKEEEVIKQSAEEMKQILLSFASAHNKGVKRQIRTTPPVKKTNRKP